VAAALAESEIVAGLQAKIAGLQAIDLFGSHARALPDATAISISRCSSQVASIRSCYGRSRNGWPQS
jgi:hypothetical protein